MAKNKPIISLVIAVALLMVGIFCLSFLSRITGSLSGNNSSSNCGTSQGGENNGNNNGDNSSNEQPNGSSDGENNGGSDSEDGFIQYLHVENASTEYEPNGNTISVSGDVYSIHTDANFDSFIPLNRYGQFTNSGYDKVEISFVLKNKTGTNTPSDFTIFPLFYNENGSLSGIAKKTYILSSRIDYDKSLDLGYVDLISEYGDEFVSNSVEIKYSFETDPSDSDKYIFKVHVDSSVIYQSSVLKSEFSYLTQIRVSVRFSGTKTYTDSVTISDFIIKYHE